MKDQPLFERTDLPEHRKEIKGLLADYGANRGKNRFSGWSKLGEAIFVAPMALIPFVGFASSLYFAQPSPIEMDYCKKIASVTGNPAIRPATDVYFKNKSLPEGAKLTAAVHGRDGRYASPKQYDSNNFTAPLRVLPVNNDETATIDFVESTTLATLNTPGSIRKIVSRVNVDISKCQE